RYARKLAELDRVVDKYISSGEKLPGLVMTNTGDDEIDLLEENVLAMYVYSYAENSLGIRVLNGTDEDVEIPESYTLRNADTGAVIQEQESTYNNRFYEHTIDEIHFKLKERLPAGSYVLYYGDYEIPFEIR
ncbi:MAG: hypothetical protein MJ135_04810, partial [Oscillospiraceae bacterium]|nr:hypothetical protein [Oscillospiraceae bacterium]